MEIEQVGEKSEGFMNHMFGFDDDSKSSLMNMLQYSFLAIIPIVILNKLAKLYVPEADETKGSLEILIEIVGQISFIFIGMFFIHRLITYLPTYSGETYGSINMITIILSFLIIILSLQTKLGEKVDILYERVMSLWSGTEYSISETKNTNVQVKQPIQRVGVQQQQYHDTQQNYQMRDHNMISSSGMNEQSMGGGSGGMTSIQNLPQPTKQPTHQLPQQQVPNFDSMYQEPMAANDALGGGFSLF